MWNQSKEQIFLVYGKKSSKWGFPKGHMEENETEEITAKREFYEETGFELDMNLQECNKYIIRNNVYFIVTIKDISEIQKKSNHIPDSKEIEKYQWFTINDLLKKNLQEYNFGLKTWILNKKYNQL